MATKPTKSRAPRTPRKSSAKPSRPAGAGLHPNENQRLLMDAKDAFAAQIELENIPAGTEFNDWRRAEVMKAVGRPGLSSCDSDQFDDIAAHFAELAGDYEKAFEHRMKAGKAKDNGPSEDEKNARRQLAHIIMRNLAEHIRLADISPADLAAETQDTATYQRLRAARAAILAHKDGAIREGYLVTIVKGRTSRKGLTLGRDLQTGLAERCDVKELRDILSTLRNRIAKREGREDVEKRAPGKARRKRLAKAKAAKLDTPAGTAHRPLALPGEPDPF